MLRQERRPPQRVRAIGVLLCKKAAYCSALPAQRAIPAQSHVNNIYGFYEPRNDFRRYNLCRVAILHADGRASERRRGQDADTSDEDAQQRHEECRGGEEIDKEKRADDVDKAKHEDDAARCCSSELARQAEVVGGSGHGVDLPAGRVVQKGRRDDCQEPGLEEESRRRGPSSGMRMLTFYVNRAGKNVSSRAGCACCSMREGTFAPTHREDADREDEEEWPRPRGRDAVTEAAAKRQTWAAA